VSITAWEVKKIEPITYPTKRKAKGYYIMLNGKHVGKSYAVSPRKAIVNWWWNNIKGGDEWSYREYDPEDFDVIEMER
jgi:hypothetical protein